MSHWHDRSGKKIHSIQEEKNSINYVDYSFDYKNFIIAGNDITVRLYDEDMKTQMAQMKPYLFDQAGHSGQIFCVKYFPNDISTIYSGGWDKTIHFYDTRSCKFSIQFMAQKYGVMLYKCKYISIWRLVNSRTDSIMGYKKL